jgi:hypothetical protein|tara:strand:+ start:22 stop:348 length:327 start_codon:yes stop_codon:yes gene_type:complete
VVFHPPLVVVETLEDIVHQKEMVAVVVAHPQVGCKLTLQNQQIQEAEAEERRNQVFLVLDRTLNPSLPLEVMEEMVHQILFMDVQHLFAEQHSQGAVLVLGLTLVHME